MKRLLSLWLGPETRNYLRWRWRRSPVTTLGVPFEWAWVALGLLWQRLLARRGSRAPAAAQVTGPATEPPALWLNPDLIATLANVARWQFPAQVAAILRQADLMCQGRMPLVTGPELNFTPPDWRPVVDDQEHLFSLNRWYHGVALAKAWVYTRDAKYVEQWMALLADWTAANPPDAASPVWESYSVGERIVNWCLSRALLTEAPGFRERALPALLAQLEQHARWLAEHLETQAAHNHLINNARALFMYGCLFRVEPYRQCGWEILEAELFRQIFPDGMLGEQSTHYHLLLTRIYVEISRLASALPADFAERARRMVAVGAALVRPDGSLPIVGDFSPDTDVASLVGMVALGQCRCEPQACGQTSLSEHSLWFADLTEVQAHAAAPQSGPASSHYLPQAGYWIYRTSDLHLVFQADPRAEVVRHGHADVLGVTLWTRGHELATDSGNASYNPDAWSDYFRGPRTHNILTVDGLPPYARGGLVGRLFSADYRRATARLSAPNSIGRWWSAAAEHTGYARLAQPVVVRRRIVVAPEYVWIADWVTGAGDHSLEATWHWGLNDVRDVAPGKWEVLADQQVIASAVWLKDGQPVAPQWLRGQTEPEIRGWYSPAYGRKLPSNTATLRARFSSSVRLDLLLWLGVQPSALEFAPEAGAPARIAGLDWVDELEFGDWPGGLRAARRLERA